MDEYTPLEGYNPEDEYASVEEAPKPSAPIVEPQTPPVAEPAAPIPPTAEPATPAQVYTAYPPHPTPYAQPQQPVQPQAQQPMGYYPPYPPAPAAPYYPQGYPTQPYPQYPALQAPVAPPQAPVQQPGYPVAPTPDRQQPTPSYAPAQPAPDYHRPAPAPTAAPYPPQAPYYPAQQPAPAATPAPAPTVPERPRTPTGTKVFIIILCAVLVAMVGGFIAFIAASAGADRKDTPPVDQSQPTEGIIIDDGDDGFYYNPFGENNNVAGSYEEITDTITLKADEGDTQKRDDDNSDSVGKPDEKAADIKLNPLPKDKDNEKYTTQSAYESVSDSVVTVECYDGKITDQEEDIRSAGTGTIISKDGYIVTNAHVLANSRIYTVNIVMNNGDQYPAKIVGYDTWTDLAVLKIDAKDLKPVTFGDSDLIEIGDDVIAIGSPGGEKFKNSLTKGIVSAVDRELSINKYVRYIQSDAAISPGNSGGPLCNIYGQVIGITTAKTVATYYENMSFSIPSATVEEIVGDLMHYGYVKGRCRIGFSGSEVTEEEIYYYNTPAGVIVGKIDENGALAGTNLREGDIITKLDDTEITSFQDIYDVLAGHKAGDKVTVTAQRAK